MWRNHIEIHPVNLSSSVCLYCFPFKIKCEKNVNFHLFFSYNYWNGLLWQKIHLWLKMNFSFSISHLYFSLHKETTEEWMNEWMHTHFTWCTDAFNMYNKNSPFTSVALLYFLSWQQEGATVPYHTGTFVNLLLYLHNVMHFHLIHIQTNYCK